MSTLLASPRASAVRVPSPSLSAVVAEWRQTRRPDAAGFLTQHPDVAEDRDAVVYLGYEEFCLRENAGEFNRGEPDVETFVARFPTHRDALVRMLHLHLLADENAELLAHLSASTSEAVWPEAGQSFLGFQLVRELGRGSFARVFLAHEPAAGNRTVALKVSRRGSAEARTLGRLRHPNIVHVNSVAEDETTGFVAVCMDYVDGVSLADALQWAFADGSLARASVFVAEAAPGPGLAQMPYAEGCVRLAAQIADALAHVHRAGIVHGDLKPANVTLRADGRPILIDFNLAFDHRAGDGCAGGTLAYMAPELLLAAVPADVGAPANAVRAAVAAPADVYALGVMLYELLTGRHPFGALPEQAPGTDLRGRLLQAQFGGRPSLAGAVAGVDPALARLVVSCLAVGPEDRPTASAVAEGLRRYLAWHRRSARWLRRHPRALSAVAASAVAVLAVSAAFPLGGSVRPPDASRDQVAVEKGRAAHGEGNSVEAERQFDRALAQRPDDPEALLGRARARLGNGNVPGAIDDLKRAAKHTNDPRVHALLGFCYNQGPKHDWANDSYRAALKAKFANAAVHNNLGYGYLQRGSFAEAEAHLALAVELDRKLTAAWHNRAVLELRLAYRDKRRVPTEGVRFVREAIHLGPVTDDLYRDAAVLCAVASMRSTDPAAKDEYRSASLDYLEKAIEQGLDVPQRRDYFLVKFFDRDPRFLKLLDADVPEKKARHAVRYVNPLDRN